jgi:hypothetical protein
MLSNANSKPDKSMTEDQFTQIVEAIMNGKYSWACVLILKFAGYNPLHYIPYRTFNRLIKENGFPCRVAPKPAPAPQRQSNLHKHASVTRIRDLGHLESLPETYPTVQGGHSAWSSCYPGEDESDYYFWN